MFLDTKNGGKYIKRPQNYQMATYIIYPIDVIYIPNGIKNIPIFSITRPSKLNQNWEIYHLAILLMTTISGQELCQEPGPRSP
jgi:hypothetical protein